MKKEVKFVKDGQEKVIFVTKPNAKQLSEAQLHSSKVFARLINDEQDGKPTALLRSKLTEFMVKTGLWGEEQEKKLVALQDQIVKNENALKSGGIKLSEARKLALDTRRLRGEQFELVSKKNELDARTAEGTAENARFNYLASVCLLDESGQRLFSSVDEYNQADDEHVYKAAFELASMISTVDTKWEDNLPENKFLRDYKFVDEKLRLINKDGHLVDVEGKLINEDGRFVAYRDGEQYFVDRHGNEVDKDGNPKVEFTPFIED